MVHIDERFLVDGLFDMAAAQTISRTGYRGDCVLGDHVLKCLGLCEICESRVGTGTDPMRPEDASNLLNLTRRKTLNENFTTY